MKGVIGDNQKNSCSDETVVLVETKMLREARFNMNDGGIYTYISLATQTRSKLSCFKTNASAKIIFCNSLANDVFNCTHRPRIFNKAIP